MIVYLLVTLLFCPKPPVVCVCASVCGVVIVFPFRVCKTKLIQFNLHIYNSNVDSYLKFIRQSN